MQPKTDNRATCNLQQQPVMVQDATCNVSKSQQSAACNARDAPRNAQRAMLSVAQAAAAIDACEIRPGQVGGTWRPVLSPPSPFSHVTFVHQSGSQLLPTYLPTYTHTHTHTYTHARARAHTRPLASSSAPPLSARLQRPLTAPTSICDARRCAYRIYGRGRGAMVWLRSADPGAAGG